MSDHPELPLWNVGFALSRLGHRARQTFLEALAPWQLRPAHYGILAILAARGPASQRELADMTGIDRGDLVRFLDTLEQRGLAQRRDDPADRRRYAVELTAAGRELLRELNVVAEQVNEAIVAPLDDAERQLLEPLLRKLWAATDVGATPKNSYQDR